MLLTLLSAPTDHYCLLRGAVCLQVVSLGSHLMDPSPASPPLLLMEVMPQGGWVGLGGWVGGWVGRGLGRQEGFRRRER